MLEAFRRRRGLDVTRCNSAPAADASRQSEDLRVTPLSIIDEEDRTRWLMVD